MPKRESTSSETDKQTSLSTLIDRLMGAAITAAQDSWARRLGAEWESDNKVQRLREIREEYNNQSLKKEEKDAALIEFMRKVADVRGLGAIFGNSTFGHTASAQAFYQGLENERVREEVNRVLDKRPELYMHAPKKDGSNQSEFAKALEEGKGRVVVNKEVNTALYLTSSKTDKKTSDQQTSPSTLIDRLMGAAITAAEGSWARRLGAEWESDNKVQRLREIREEYNNQSLKKEDKDAALVNFMNKVAEVRGLGAIFGNSKFGHTASAKVFYQGLENDVVRYEVNRVLQRHHDLTINKPSKNGSNQNDFAAALREKGDVVVNQTENMAHYKSEMKKITSQGATTKETKEAGNQADDQHRHNI